MHEHVEAFLERQAGLKAENTAANRQSELRHFEGWREARDLPLEAVTAADVDAYFVACGDEGYAPSSIKNRYYGVKSLFDYLAGVGDILDDNPFYRENGEPALKLSEYTNGNGNGSGARKRQGPGPIYVNPGEVEACCDGVASPALRNELLLRLLFQTGVRAGEAASIRLDDLDRDERSIDVLAEKTDEWRTVYYHSSLDILLDQWLDAGGRAGFITAGESPYLFLSEGKPGLDHHDVNDIVKEAAENAGIQEVVWVDQRGNNRYRVTAHTFRHGHAVQALKSGIDVRTLQKHLGHANLDTTMQYLELLDSDIKEAYRANFRPAGA